MTLKTFRALFSIKTPVVFLLVFSLVVGAPRELLAATWTDRSSAMPSTYPVGLAASADGQTLVTGGLSFGAKNVYVSHNGGASWSIVLTDHDAGSYPWTSFAMSADGEDIVGVQNGGYIWVSHNGGTTWAVEDGVNHSWNSVTMTANGGYLAAVATSDSLVELSYDGGNTWLPADGEDEDPGLLTSAHWDTVSYSPNGDYLLVGQQGGTGYMATSTDHGITWGEGVGPLSTDWYTVAAANDGTMLAGGYLGLYVSHDGGSAWSTGVADPGVNWITTALSADGATAIAGTNGGYVYLSTNGGSTWDPQSPDADVWRGSAIADDSSYATVIGGYPALYTTDPSAIEATIPDAPSELSVGADSITEHSMDLSWTVPDSDGGSAITDYHIEYKPHSDVSWTTFEHDPSTETTITLTGLTTNTNYDMRVSTVNEIGESDPSDVLTVPTDRHVISNPGGQFSHGGGGGGGSGTGGDKKIQDQINALIAQIAALKEQLGGGGSPGDTGGTVRDLTLGMEGAGVKSLQTLLVAQNTGPAAAALAAHGVTDYFGELTRAALAEYQAAHGITPAAGYFGEKTRAQMKAANLSGLWW